MRKRSMVRKIINLSPLVDVFMIVIFWYIMFSSQNLKNQEQEFQKTIDSFEKTLSEMEAECEENTALKQQIKSLERENERMTAVMEYEGRYILLWFSGGLTDQREVKVILEENTQELSFSSEDREKGEFSAKLKTILEKYFGTGKRCNVIFLYDGGNSYARDIAAMETTILTLQKEQYFVYTKINLSR